MIKLYFHETEFNEKQKELILYIWNHLLSQNFTPSVFDLPECPSGFATTIVKSENGIDEGFYVRENRIMFTLNKFLNRHFTKMEIFFSKDEISRFENGSELLQYMYKKTLEKENFEIDRINKR